jgi:hypothetical protein
MDSQQEIALNIKRSITRSLIFFLKDVFISLIFIDIRVGSVDMS